MAKDDLREVKEIVEVDSEKDVNMYLKKGWILLYIYFGTQLCYTNIKCSNNFEKLQSFDKVLKSFVLGRVK